MNAGPDGRDETLRRLVGRSAVTNGRRKPTGRNALAAGRQRCRSAGEPRFPHPVSAGLEDPEEPSRGESRVYRKALKIGGESRAIQDRRRPAIAKVNGQPIRGDVDSFAGTLSATGNGVE